MKVPILYFDWQAHIGNIVFRIYIDTMQKLHQTLLDL